MNRNINPLAWGKDVWKGIFWISIAYSDNPVKAEMVNMKNYLNSIGRVLPCTSCQYNFSNYLIDHPVNDLVVRNRESLIRWLVDLKNHVANSNGNPNNNTTYDDIIKQYGNNFPTGVKQSAVTDSKDSSSTHQTAKDFGTTNKLIEHFSDDENCCDASFINKNYNSSNNNNNNSNTYMMILLIIIIISIIIFLKLKRII